MSSYVTTSDLNSATGIDIWNFAKNPDLATLKLDVAELDIDKLKTTFVDLGKICNV